MLLQQRAERVAAGKRKGPARARFAGKPPWRRGRNHFAEPAVAREASSCPRSSAGGQRAADFQPAANSPNAEPGYQKQQGALP
ncbi:hypothetical protein ACNKHS_25600 [Shigella flexneri]